MTALLLAASSNDLLKAVYAAGFGGWARSSHATAALVVIAVAGLAAAACVALRS